jgi:hypothetical protein
MSKKENEVKIEIFPEEHNPKTLTYRCIEAILIKNGILNKDDKKQIQHFRKNTVPDINKLLIAIENMYQKQNIEDLVSFYLQYGVDVQYH